LIGLEHDVDRCNGVVAHGNRSPLFGPTRAKEEKTLG
jgi:hypothetical protein